MGAKAAIRPGEPVAAALRAVAREVLAQAAAAIANKARSDAVAVHDLRKAMKRWRALLRLLDPVLGQSGRALRHEARDLARALGRARDVQAALDGFADTAKASRPLSQRSAATIAARLQELRVEVEDASLNGETRARIAAALVKAERSVDAWPLDRVDFPALARELTATYRRARRLVPGDWAGAAPEALHALRRRVVAHRYQMDLVEPLWPKLGRVWIEEAQKLRDRLGAHQDLVQLAALTAPHAPLAPWRARLLPLIAERQAVHAAAAAKVAKRLFAERPRVFRRRLEALWSER